MRVLFYIFCLCLVSLTCHASVPIEFNDSSHTFLFKGVYLDYLEDPQGSFSPEDVRTIYANKFISGKPGEVVNNKHLNSTYWTRITIINKCTQRKNWVVELYDYKIDTYEAYLPDDNGVYRKYVGGSKFKFDLKDYKHKNFIHDLYDLPHSPTTIYFRIKSERRVVFIGMVRTVQKMLEYSNTEYFMLSLFYGIVIAMIIYNSFLYVSTLDLAYFFYVLYVSSIGLLALTKDGLGFQYLWKDHPEWNDTIPIIANFSTVCWALIYARSFLNTRIHLPLLDKGILLILFARGLLFVATFYDPFLAYNSWVDLSPLLFVYVLGIISWSKGYRMARFYILAFTLFFFGFLLSVLNDFHVISSHPMVIYGFNIGVLCEMLLLSLALADRIKILTMEKEAAQKEIILKAMENEQLKDKINSELEGKVQERTRELEAKNKELDIFVYRSSHDIKGPLKSIIGLTSIGMTDIKDDDARNYFDHILKSSLRLDAVVEHLLKVMETKESAIKISKINFESLINDIFFSLEHLPYFSLVKTELEVNQQYNFFSDENMIYSVLQNLVENALKYHDPEKTNPFIKVRITVEEGMALIDIEDNGLGIEKALQEKIFDMFYKVHQQSDGSGLGLYMTKIYVEKLGGTMQLTSEIGEGSVFSIKLKNHLSVTYPESLSA